MLGNIAGILEDKARNVCEGWVGGLGWSDDGRVKDFSEKCLSSCVGIEKEAGNQEKWRVSRCNGYFCMISEGGYKSEDEGYSGEKSW
jgi:hypothetical protein